MLIKNALIATASELYKGDIHIKDGIIKEIGENLDIKDEEYNFEEEELSEDEKKGLLFTLEEENEEGIVDPEEGF